LFGCRIMAAGSRLNFKSPWVQKFVDFTKK
jgi:hypothetical protein